MTVCLRNLLYYLITLSGDRRLFKTNYARKDNEAELVERISRIIEKQTAKECITKLSEAGVPAGRVNNIVQA